MDTSNEQVLSAQQVRELVMSHTSWVDLPRTVQVELADARADFEAANLIVKYDLLTPPFRLQLVVMTDDPEPVDPGSRGTVTYVGGQSANVDWDSGRSLSVLADSDTFVLLGDATHVSAFDMALLRFADVHYHYPAAREQAIWSKFNMSPTRYFQRTLSLIKDERVYREDPSLVKRLRAARDYRQNHREPWTAA